eukprot:scaffold12381_cov117-Isochrysis_galbana.AAC.4
MSRWPVCRARPLVPVRGRYGSRRRRSLDRSTLWHRGAPVAALPLPHDLELLERSRSAAARAGEGRTVGRMCTRASHLASGSRWPLNLNLKQMTEMQIAYWRP